MLTQVKWVKKVQSRKFCESCEEKPATKKNTFLLEGMRSNPASAAYGLDDCSWCEDEAVFTCDTCKPGIPSGYVECSKFSYGDRFASLFLEWDEVEDDIYGAAESVISTAFGNTEGFTESAQLVALRLAVSVLRDAMDGSK